MVAGTVPPLDPELKGFEVGVRRTAPAGKAQVTIVFHMSRPESGGASRYLDRYVMDREDAVLLVHDLEGVIASLRGLDG